jgi:hypothetical protein
MKLSFSGFAFGRSRELGVRESITAMAWRGKGLGRSENSIDFNQYFHNRIAAQQRIIFTRLKAFGGPMTARRRKRVDCFAELMAGLVVIGGDPDARMKKMVIIVLLALAFSPQDIQRAGPFEELATSELAKTARIPTNT